LVLDLLNLNYFGCSAKKVGGGVSGGLEYDGVVVEDCGYERNIVVVQD
jgi:hypothetical protein